LPKTVSHKSWNFLKEPEVHWHHHPAPDEGNLADALCIGNWEARVIFLEISGTSL